MALAVLELLDDPGFPVTEKAIRFGLAWVRWPGRLERVLKDPGSFWTAPTTRPAAHSLAQVLRQERPSGRLFLVPWASWPTEDVEAILARLLPLAQVVIATRARYSRAANPEELARPGPGLRGGNPQVKPDVAQRPGPGPSPAGPQDRIVVTGSLYTVGEAKEALAGIVGEPHGRALG